MSRFCSISPTRTEARFTRLPSNTTHRPRLMLSAHTRRTKRKRLMIARSSCRFLLRLGSEPELVQNAGIYVAGHPEGRFLSVALNSQVVYPFKLDDETSVNRLIEWALLRMFNSSSEYDRFRSVYAARAKAFFTTNYKQVGAMGFYFRPTEQPTIGADPDTNTATQVAPRLMSSAMRLSACCAKGPPMTRTFQRVLTTRTSKVSSDVAESSRKWTPRSRDGECNSACCVSVSNTYLARHGMHYIVAVLYFIAILSISYVRRL